MAYLTLSVTDNCSAGCAHCRCSSSGSDADLSTLKSEIFEASQRHCHVVVTGGEPFEYPYLLDLISELEKRKLMYRIATGGHRPLSRYIGRLKASSWLTEIQIGTDVLMRERCSLENVYDWHANVRLLGIHLMAYSLKFTASENVDVSPIIKALEHTNPSVLRISKLDPCVSFGALRSAEEIAEYAVAGGVDVVYEY